MQKRPRGLKLLVKEVRVRKSSKMGPRLRKFAETIVPRCQKINLKQICEILEEN
jgi:hypothetical protein